LNSVLITVVDGSHLPCAAQRCRRCLRRAPSTSSSTSIPPTSRRSLATTARCVSLDSSNMVLVALACRCSLPQHCWCFEHILRAVGYNSDLVAFSACCFWLFLQGRLALPQFQLFLTNLREETIRQEFVFMDKAGPLRLAPTLPLSQSRYSGSPLCQRHPSIVSGNGYITAEQFADYLSREEDKAEVPAQMRRNLNVCTPWPDAQS
jgi:hypothetical protein